MTITSVTNKYQEYKQDFVVEGLEYAIQLYAGEKEIDEQQKAHPGVIRYRTYGDKELEDILQEIEKRTNISHYDLNNDNAVDLVDLQLFSTSYTANPKENILSTIETSIPSSIVKPEHADNVEVKSGSLDVYKRQINSCTGINFIFAIILRCFWLAGIKDLGQVGVYLIKGLENGILELLEYPTAWAIPESGTPATLSI